MKRIGPLILFISFSLLSHAQFFNDTGADIKEFMEVLASDSLKGRGNFTEDLHKAAGYIAGCFAEDSLETFPGNNSYLVPFAPGKKLKDKWKDPDGNYDPRKVLFNVVGLLQGKTLPNEAIIFSSHYDHLGMEGRKISGKKIFNGANDNASGTAAMMAIARHFARTRDNERTLIFCAFAGEELGLFGSTIFSGSLEADNIVAVINMEMIGRHNIGGPNRFFITGTEYSDLDEIIEKNLEGTGVTMIEEPNQVMKLFQRSDNLPFAMKGIPAHTIMSSDDNDECYHQTCDDLERIDFWHMENLVNAILAATKPMIDGKQTPSRITKKIEPLKLGN